MLLGALVTGSLFIIHPGCGGDEPIDPPVNRQVRVQILGINDFHGALENPTGSSGRIKTPQLNESGANIEIDAGGAKYLAQTIQTLRQENANTVVVSAGDLIGASPLVSALFHDEPTIEAMNLIGLDINSVGNHEFDEGFGELLRMQTGGCHPVDGCQDGTPFAGAKFSFLAANVVTDTGTGKTLFPAYEIREFEGIKIAFIGMTLEGTPEIVTPSGIAGLTFKDEVETVNEIVPQLQQQGVNAIVVVVHEGGLPTGLYDECPEISGPIKEIVENFNDEVDVVVTGHTHQAYNCVIDGKRVTSAASNGRLVTQINLVLDTDSNDVVEATAKNHIVERTTPNAAVESFVNDYVNKAAPLRDRVIGQTSGDLTRAPSESGEFVMGNLIADAMLASTRDEQKGAAVIALMNPGGVRADINAGPITYGQAFTVQPFTNNLVTKTLTGAQIERVLEQQFPPLNTSTRIMQVSTGFSYTWKDSGPDGDKIDPSTIKLNGTTIDPAATYRVTMNNFMASGGDGYTVFNEGTEALTGAIDVDALEVYLRDNNPLTPPDLGRITREP